MAETARKPATYEDVLRAPEHLVAELLEGELYLSPRPSIGHGIVQSALSAGLFERFHWGRGGPGGWILTTEPELHLGSEPAVLVPDLAGWRRARMPELPATPFVELSPDWVCEVLSPGTARLDRTKKLPLYAREGIGHAWLVDPLQRALEVLRNEGGRWFLLGTFVGDAKVRAEPFEAVELELGMLWGGVVPGAPGA